MCTSAGTRGGKLAALGVGRIPRFALGPDLVVYLDAELDKGIKILRCILIGKGFSEFPVETPSEVRDFGVCIQVQDCGQGYKGRML